ncbi:hypothetical protein LTR17_011578 [Elasticomyces elasticus]|nr:hypothetical protein LTR17_011578 [Elasticomyces elasticus]
MDRLYREAADRRARSGAPSPSSYHPYSREPLGRTHSTRESSSRPSRGFGTEDDMLAAAMADIRGRYPSVSRERAPSRSYGSYEDNYGPTGRRSAVSSYPLDGANPPMPSRSGRQMPLSYETRYGERSGTYGARSTLADSLLTRGFPGGPPRAPEPRYERSYESSSYPKSLRAQLRTQLRVLQV